VPGSKALVRERGDVVRLSSLGARARLLEVTSRFVPLSEMGGVPKSHTSPELRCGHAIEQRRWQHAYGEVDAGLLQQGSKTFATRCEHSM
jgi:hypothetical protein